MDREAWWTTVYGVPKSQDYAHKRMRTRMHARTHTHTHMHTHSYL